MNTEKTLLENENKPSCLTAVSNSSGSLKKYDVIYADPAWRYDFSKSISRDIENQYPTMTIEEICALKVPTKDNAVLYMWATAPKLLEAIKVIDAWVLNTKHKRFGIKK